MQSIMFCAFKEAWIHINNFLYFLMEQKQTVSSWSECKVKRRKQQQKLLNKTKVPKTMRDWRSRALSSQFGHLDSQLKRASVIQKRSPSEI